jgi:hypothetical protein
MVRNAPSAHTDQSTLFIESFRFLVASPRVQDLLLSAKYLFVAAMVASALPGVRRSTLLFDESQSPNESRMTRR